MTPAHLVAPITDLYGHSFNKHLLSTYYVPIQGSVGTVVNKITPSGAGMGETKLTRISAEGVTEAG